MKHTSVWGKILLLVMSVVLALSCLVACNDEEIGKLEDTTAAIDADLTELKDLVNKIKTTADAAATAVKLAEVATALEAASAKADAAATAEALAAAKEELKALTETNKAGLATANTAIDAAKAQIATIETKLAELGGKDASFTTEIAAIKTAAAELETSLKNEIKALNEKYDALKISVDAKADASDLDKVANDVAALQAALALANEQIKALQDAPNFAENYQFATAVLYGDELVEGVEYSLEAFDKLVATVKASDYATADYAEFAALVARLEFFLGRAISVDAIIDCFEKLQLAIDDMPTLLESLQAKIAEVELITADKDCIADLEDVYSRIDALNNDADANNDIKIPDADLATYNLIVAAHDNIVAAAADTTGAVDAIAAIGKVIFNDSKDEIAAAKAALDTFATTYFANAQYNAYYAEDVATALISNYDVYTVAVARDAQLDNANTYKVVVADAALNYDSTRPLWSDKAALDEDKAEYAAWLVEYAIDETDDAQSIANIYGDELALLEKASAYADAMTLVYTNTVFVADEVVGVEALNAKIDALLAENTPLVLWTKLADAVVIDKMVAEILVPALAGVADYNSDIDGNGLAMITVDRVASFDTMYEVMNQLDLANEMLDGLYDSHATLLTKVSFNDYNDIQSLKNAVAQIYADYYVTFGDANYVAFAAEKDVNQLILDLEAEYNGITAKVREIYDNVNKYLDPNADMPLAFGNQLDGFMAEVVKIMSMGVTNVNLPLLGEGDAEDVNLETLFDNLEIVIQKYVAKAEAAELAATTITLNIVTNGLLPATTLDNYDEIDGAYKALVEWIELYLAADVALADGDIAAALAAVVDVKVFGEDDKYTFVSADNYNACLANYNAIVELYNTADAAWDILAGELGGLTNDNFDIHTMPKYEAALANWKNYVETYYGANEDSDDKIDDAEGEFGEVAVYDLFMAKYSACEILVGEADGKKQAIEVAINALEGKITVENYAEQLLKIADIEALIAEYVDTYCDNAINEKAWCENCLDRDLYVALLVKEATAELYKYAEATKALTDDAKDADIDDTVYMWVVIIAGGKDTTTIDSSLATAKSAIAKKAPCCVPDAAADAHLDEDEDCKCDLCGNVVAHVDADPKDCKCDKCGADLGHVDADPKDCVCDKCNTKYEHKDSDNNCACDNCGTTLEHSDEDWDCVCDNCDAPSHVDEFVNVNGGIFNGGQLGAETPDGSCDLCGAAIA